MFVNSKFQLFLVCYADFLPILWSRDLIIEWRKRHGAAKAKKFWYEPSHLPHPRRIIILFPIEASQFWDIQTQACRWEQESKQISVGGSSGCEGSNWGWFWHIFVKWGWTIWKRKQLVVFWKSATFTMKVMKDLASLPFRWLQYVQTLKSDTVVNFLLNVVVQYWTIKEGAGIVLFKYLLLRIPLPLFHLQVWTYLLICSV